VQHLNHALVRATVEVAREVGLTGISFLAADVTSSAFNRLTLWPAERQSAVALTGPELRALEAEIESLIAAGECGGFVAESPQKLRRIADHFRAHFGLSQPVAPVCNAPWVSVVIETDGVVRPCFFHPPIGKLDAGMSLANVINGPAAVAFRKNLDVASNPTCKRCVCSLNYR
jgi:MoaA/NifB/PqqE/SkfB family radical SAM enzyme